MSIWSRSPFSKRNSEKSWTFSTSEGSAYPLGAHCMNEGVNFAIFSANAEKIELCLFDETGKNEQTRITLSGLTDQVWHVFVKGLPKGSLYAYRVHGPYEPSRGHRFNPNKCVLDPYAREIKGELNWGDALYAFDLDGLRRDMVMSVEDNAALIPKCVVVDTKIYSNSAQSRPLKPKVPWEKTIIYETHVRGFTKLNSKIPKSIRGTYKGFSHPDNLDYIQSLGVTSIELLPIHTFFDEPFLTEKSLTNYWGYNSLLFFSPINRYANKDALQEFRDLVDAVHERGMEVILDVVYNHTTEGNHLGPSLCFRGIDNASYYMLEKHDSRFYANDTGCGNTMNLRHPRVLQMVMDSLRFWLTEMGVDGFRFDLATVMGREASGFDPGSGFFDAVKQDPIVGQCKLIAEPWDIGPGGYQLGNYPSGWSEWNDRYRDTCRRYWRGDRGMLPEFARRIHGSSDVFEHDGRSPRSSINFICSHDGFTLHDLVSYAERHNQANKEDNRDGHHNNHSANYGVEGPTDNQEIICIRERQKRNFLATLFLSQGVPMILAGDEIGRTQKGNNNAYCQDNDINWIDWANLTDDQWQLKQFVQNLIVTRNKNTLLSAPYYIHRPDQCRLDNEVHCEVRWFSGDGEEMEETQWVEPHNHILVWMLERIKLNHESSEKSSNTGAKEKLLILFNASDNDEDVKLPLVKNIQHWQCLIDTRYPSGKSPNSKAKNIVKVGKKTNLIAKSLKLLKAIYIN